MIVELITTGTELILGRVPNSHQQWLGRELAGLGCTFSREVTVPDAAPDVQQAVRESLSRADLVITTGGLGPTSDDVTREAIARMLGRELRMDAGTLARIQDFFTRRRRPMPERVRVQALVPEGALVLPNLHGTAPGLALELNPNPFRTGGGTSWLVMLPGPPRELRPMFANLVTPLLHRVFALPHQFACRTLRTIGLAESLVQEALEGPLRELVAAGIELGYCARPGEVDVQLAARGSGAEKQVEEAERIVRAHLGVKIFGTGDETLAQVVVRRLAERGQTLALAESCTGGGLAHRVTDVPGASEVFRAGWVTYSNEAKEAFLGVQAGTLAQHGAVSEPVARQMAEGARRAGRADYALAVTGIAGPSGGTPEKPVGTVFIALASAVATQVQKRFNPFDRSTFKEITVQQALDQLRLSLQSSG